jgi:hypothetical protein
MGTRYALGCLRDSHDDQDFRFSRLANAQGLVELPPAVDLRPFASPVRDQGELGCHDDQTEVLTRQGWKHFATLLHGDELATVDPETLRLTYERPTRLVRYAYRGELICAKNRTVDFKVTPNHRMLVRKWDERARTLSAQYGFVEAKDLGWYCGLLNRVAWDGHDLTPYYVLPGIAAHRRVQRDDTPVPMEAWLRFLGLYVAEGTLCGSVRHRSGRPRPVIAYRVQLAASKEREKAFTREVLAALGIRAMECRDRFVFENKRIFATIEALGLRVRAPEKFVPPFVFDLPASQIRAFLLGHFMGDGCAQYGHRAHYTSSARLAEDLQRLIFLSGDESRVAVREPRMSMMADGRSVIGRHREHRISVCERKNLSLERKAMIFSEPYDGEVFCAEVPTYHTLVTRRNGSILVSGNSCVGQGTTCGLLELLLIRAGRPAALSALSTYYFARRMEHTVNQDAGAMIRDGMKVLRARGAPPEADWPYIVERFTEPPSPEARHHARAYQIASYHRVNGLLEMKHALAMGLPVAFGVDVFASFMSDDTAHTGLIPLPNVEAEECLGGHCLCAVGYSDRDKLVCFRNSWGPWGAAGCGYLPYAYFQPQRRLVSDAWTGILQ